MSEFGLKIRNYEAAVLYEYNLGIREYATYTDAMFSNSLLSDYLKTIGLNVTKAESTSDIVCIKFSFGTRDYEEIRKESKKNLKKKTTKNKESTFRRFWTGLKQTKTSTRKSVQKNYEKNFM